MVLFTITFAFSVRNVIAGAAPNRVLRDMPESLRVGGLIYCSRGQFEVTKVPVKLRQKLAIV